MSVPKKLVNFLEKNSIKYELVEHRTVYTAWDLAQTLHVKPSQIVKTVVVKLKGKVPLLVLIPAQKNVDKKKLGNVVYNNVQKIQKKLAKENSSSNSVPSEWNFPPQELKGKSYSVIFAQEKWMKEKLIGKIGATPPFGRLLKIPVIMDSVLLKEKELIMNSGDYSVSIKMKTKDFEKLEQPMRGNISIKKK